MKKINKKYSIVGGAILLIAIIVLVSTRSSSAAFESAEVSIADVIQDINVTGKIAPEQKADLSFEKIGIVSSVSVKVGDVVKKGQILGSLDTREAAASYQSARANALSEQAKLDELQKGTRFEEVAISGESYVNASNNFSNTIRNTFAQIDSTLRSTTDDLFDNADSYAPTIKAGAGVSISTSNKARELEKMRTNITIALDKWNREYAGKDISLDITSLFAQQTIQITKSFFDTLISYIKNPSSTDKETMLAGLDGITTIDKNFITAKTDFDNARGDYILKKSGNTSDTVRSQIAKVEQADAQALSQQAILDKMTIRAPFDGIVTLVEPTVGETMPANTTAFTVITTGQYKIEVFVPESNISKVSIGNIGKVTLDAYGKDTFFDARVSRIDPAETVVEGIPTYKVTLSIIEDPCIRSGMTADINIVTAEKMHVLTIPTRAIVEKAGAVTVRKVNGKSFTEVPVTIGLKGSNGNTELVSGLVAGDSVVTKTK